MAERKIESGYELPGGVGWSMMCAGGRVCVGGGSLCFPVIPNTEIAAMIPI